MRSEGGLGEGVWGNVVTVVSEVRGMGRSGRRGRGTGWASLQAVWLGAITMLVTAAPEPVSADSYWNLPQRVSPDNTDVSVEIVTGDAVFVATVRDLAGRIWLGDPAQPGSLRGELRVSPHGISTGDPLRDLQVGAWIGALGGSAVTVSLAAVESGGCVPHEVDRGRRCSGVLQSDVGIAGDRGPLRFPFTLMREGRGYRIEGAHSISAPGGGPPGPLALLAAVVRRVTIRFASRW